MEISKVLAIGVDILFLIVPARTEIVFSTCKKRNFPFGNLSELLSFSKLITTPPP